ncbi:DUF3987 domain-containing protein [Polluticoccus soli]|uniref:DUF3987 domain-containing protein n=1 Tax=Polluticoccus soli TaxID=3034150 RepID=UPI0023E0F568|nr:DUF3987 domain-containing protein [Flavipsychrobacter sp. JY13-12]
MTSINNISIIKNHNNVVENATLQAIWAKIKGKGYLSEIAELRKLIALGKDEEAQRVKNSLTAFTTSGTFKEKRKSGNLIDYSQYVMLDIDKLDGLQVESIKQKAIAIKHTKMCFISPSGNGLKIVVKVNTPATLHKEAYKQVIDFYKQSLHIDFDEKTSDITRLCYFSHDPTAYFIDNEEVFEVSVPAEPNNDEELSVETAFKKAIEFTERISEYRKGNRNNFLFQLLCNCNRLGITQSNTLILALRHYEKTFDRAEIANLVSSVYSKYHNDFGNYQEYENGKDLDGSSENEVANLPFIPDEVIDSLPEFMQFVANSRTCQRERDVLVISMLVLFSGAFYNVTSRHDGQTVFPNLFSFIVAGAGSGKGVAKIARKLFEEFSDELEERCNRSLAEYLSSNSEQPDEKSYPQYIQFFVPGNSSTTAIINTLKRSDGVGVIFESEADALGNNLSNDWGDFSYILRCAFHQESISIGRANSKAQTVKKTKLAALLSGTPGQLPTIIRSAENGLFSRFTYYVFSSRNWRNTFEKSENDIRRFSKYISWNINRIVQYANANQIEVRLSEEQSKKLSDHFELKFNQLKQHYSEDIDSVVKRMPLMVLKLCMVLTAIDKWEIRGSNKAICSDNHFDASVRLVDVFLDHALYIYELLPQKSVQVGRNSNRLNEFLDYLPVNAIFSRADALPAAKKMGVHHKSISNYLFQLVKAGLLQKLGHGKYQRAKNK